MVNHYVNDDKSGRFVQLQIMNYELYYHEAFCFFSICVFYSIC